MKIAIISLLILVSTTLSFANSHASPQPLSDGDYTFKHKFAEANQSEIESINLLVKIKGNHIVVINNDRFDVFPKGLIEEGTLMWHAKSGQWIIGSTPDDIEAPEVGGCTDGPTVIDLINKIYWTC